MDDLVMREKYLKEALLFRDTDLVKVVTGIRRCGKSSLLQLVRQHIENEAKEDRSFVTANLEMRGLGIRNADDLYAYVVSRMGASGRTYVFLDEIQRIDGWHDVVNSLRVEYDCDIYITGSNAQLLSSELSTYLSGRYVEVKMLPLSFSEYLDFCRLSFEADSNVTMSDAHDAVLFDDVFRRYLTYGGMPAMASLSTDQAMHERYLEGLFNTVVVRDIMNRERNRAERALSDPDLLLSICEYLSDAIGCQISAERISQVLTSNGRKTSRSTVASYLKALEEAFVVYPCKRFDIHGKAILKTLPKYYLVDLGLRSYLSGYRRMDRGFVFENAVYLQMLYEGWSVHVGKLYQSEVDFVAIKDGRQRYIQVADEIFDEATRLRELSPFFSIRDNYEKLLIVRQGDVDADVNGIRIVSARNFFLPER